MYARSCTDWPRETRLTGSRGVAPGSIRTQRGLNSNCVSCFGIHPLDHQPVLKQPDALVVDSMPRINRKRDADRQQFDSGERQHQPGADQNQQESDQQRKQRKRDIKTRRTGVGDTEQLRFISPVFQDWFGVRQQISCAIAVSRELPLALALPLPCPAAQRLGLSPRNGYQPGDKLTHYRRVPCIHKQGAIGPQSQARQASAPF